MEYKIRVRFAPSPTGFLHVGSLRTALYNYLYARKTGGSFILRIEDTDRNRYVEGAVENLISTLKTMGLDYDEGPEKGGNFGPYFQSKRTSIYREYVDKLIADGHAYQCFCTPDDLEKMRNDQISRNENAQYDGRCRLLTQNQIKENLKTGLPYTVRLKVPNDGEITFYDLVREKVTFPWEMIDDQILIKSDGYPTYHLANVVDDHLMKITHVIRGEEWLSSIPKHLLLYQYFGWKPPKMAHLPLLLNKDKSKLSKRQGDVAVEDFLSKGYLTDALVNFVALLGWHAADDREFYTLTELEKAFSLKRISKSGAVFDLDKLNWMNGSYIRKLDQKDIEIRAVPYFESSGIDISDKRKYSRAITVLRERVDTLSEFPEKAKIFYGELKFDEEQLKIIHQENSRRLYSFWIEELQVQTEYNPESVKKLINDTQESLGVKGRDLYFPLRLALIGTTHGPDIPAIIEVLGIEDTVARLEKAKMI